MGLDSANARLSDTKLRVLCTKSNVLRARLHVSKKQHFMLTVLPVSHERLDTHGSSHLFIIHPPQHCGVECSPDLCSVEKLSASFGTRSATRVRVGNGEPTATNAAVDSEQIRQSIAALTVLCCWLLRLLGWPSQRCAIRPLTVCLGTPGFETALTCKGVLQQS